MKAYYGSRISPNMTKTPEGFLICHNVPIARTGWYDYLGQELGLNDLYDQVVKVYRSPEEVFNPAAIASFEGKSVTDEHPLESVTPTNYAAYEKGQVSNVRRGSGNESNELLADLIIKDPKLISEVENGNKREISCGYNCNYVPNDDGTYSQQQIRGNHVAVVSNGRAGHDISIKDQKPIKNKTKINGRSNKMAKPDKNNIFAKMFHVFAKDENTTPEELVEASKLNPEAKTKDGDAEQPTSAVQQSQTQVQPQPQTAATNTQNPPAADVQSPTGTETPGITELSGKMDRLIDVIGKLVESDKEIHSQLPRPEDPLDKLAKDIQTPEERQEEINRTAESSKDDDGEESVTLPPEKINQVQSDNSNTPIAAPSDKPENPIPGTADRNAILNAINAVKPVVASIKDPKERMQASDALAKSFRQQLQMMPAPLDNGYAKILKATTANAGKQVAKDKNTTDDSELGKQWAQKFNPHYKKEVK